MEIKKPATAGTLESSDCMVTVEPGNGRLSFLWRVQLLTNLEIR